MEYVIAIERSRNGFGAYLPELPGCVAVGDSEEEVRRLIHEAIELHLEMMRKDGEPIPPPRPPS